MWSSVKYSQAGQTKVWSPKKIVRTRWNLMYLTLVLHGVGTLMPWNIFINAKTVSYVSALYCYTHDKYFKNYKMLPIHPLKTTIYNVQQYSKLQSLIQTKRCGVWYLVESCRSRGGREIKYCESCN